MMAAKAPAFSLLIPVYIGDTADFFVRAFYSSVHEQTVKPSEVVIVEDGPLTPAMLAALDKVTVKSPVAVIRVRLPKNVGLARALEAGLKSCTNEIVARMDADDVSLPTRFEKQLALIAEGFDIVGTGLVEFEENEDALAAIRTPPTGQAEIARSARFAQPFHHPTVMFRKPIVAAVGGYEDIGPMEDYWLFARMLHQGARAENITEPLVKYRIGEGAYARRGGWDKLRTELRLQRRLRKLGFTTHAQHLRNVIVRGGYRLVPEALRRVAYRRLIASRFEASTASSQK
jgi:glycosyltransferase involved in cell wall biosynthesis